MTNTEFKGLRVTTSICIVNEEQPCFDFSIVANTEDPLSESEFETSLLDAVIYVIKSYKVQRENRQHEQLRALLTKFKAESKAAGLCD